MQLATREFLALLGAMQQHFLLTQSARLYPCIRSFINIFVYHPLSSSIIICHNPSLSIIIPPSIYASLYIIDCASISMCVGLSIFLSPVRHDRTPVLVGSTALAPPAHGEQLRGSQSLCPGSKLQFLGDNNKTMDFGEDRETNPKLI